MKMNESSCQISDTYCIYLSKIIWFALSSFLENPLNIFYVSILNTVYLELTELMVSPLTFNKDNSTHVHVHKHHINSQTVFKNSKKEPDTTIS